MSVPASVTFLLTDIEGSTRLWEQNAEAMDAALARHSELAARIIPEHAGRLVKERGEGDSLFAVFSRAPDAVACACRFQQALYSETWPAGLTLRVRMALQTGDATLRDGDYFGPTVNRCARLRAAAHGGQILLSPATQVQARDQLPEGARLRDLGTHRLKDLQQPERIYQLLHPDLPADFPPPRSLEAFAHNLPVQLTRFIGREREIAIVSRLLRGAHLLTLTGAGGCGKTRLSLQVAADLVGEFADGVWLVELAALSDPALVPRTVASALGVSEAPGRPIHQSLIDHLRTRQALLVLDNCEHLLAACAELAEPMLQACPNLRILATSREGLGIVGEQTYRVPSLALPDPRALPPPARLSEFEAVQLFVDRAALSQPTFALTAANAAAVTQVCARLDGIPMAIELAAARVNALPVEQIAARLDDRFRLLTGAVSRRVLPRQQTLRALIDWSYDLLSEPERALLSQLSIFSGGWTLEAAEQVCGDEVLDLLARLVDRSLVVYEEQEGEARYRLLETMRQYARDRLQESGEGDAVRARHRDYFLRLAEAEAAARSTGEAQWQAWCDRIEAEHDNLRSVLAWTLGEPGDADAGLRLAAALGMFWRMRGYFREGRDWLERALSRRGRRDRGRAMALNAAATLASMMGDYERCEALEKESLALYRQLGDDRGVAVLLGNLGMTLLLRDDLDLAEALLEESLDLWRGMRETGGVAYTLRCLSEVARCRTDYASARALLEESLTFARECGQNTLVADALGCQGAVARLQGDFSRAYNLLRESVHLFQAERGVPDVVAQYLQELALVDLAEGRPERAARLLSATETLRKEISAPLPPSKRIEQEACVAALRAALGEESFAKAWSEGRAMSQQQAIAFALQDGKGDASHPPGS